MYGNGAGTPIRRVRLTASAAAVVGTLMQASALFLTVAAATLTTRATTLVSVLCVPVLIKNLKALRA